MGTAQEVRQLSRELINNMMFNNRDVFCFQVSLE